MFRLSHKWGAILLLPLIILCFLPGFTEIWRTYTSSWLFENFLAAVTILIFFGWASWRYGRLKNNDPETFPGWIIGGGIIFVCICLLINNILGGFQILPAILAYLGVYFWLGFWLRPLFWRRSILVFILLILTLPILERLQKIIGFPLRLFTAQVVSILLQLSGVGNISDSTVIMTENYATTIDLPCSGMKSFYFGGVVLLAVYFLQQIKISVRSIALAAAFFALLLFFNIWRVFALVYVYGVLHLVAAGDSIHIMLGVIGFATSCFVLWWGSSHLRKITQNNPKKKFKKIALNRNKYIEYLSRVPKYFDRDTTLKFCLIVLATSSALANTLWKLPDKKVATIDQTTFNLPSMQLVVLPFSDKEQSLFINSDVTFARKMSFQWVQKNMTLLLIRSSSARSHHDPEICLQGLGYKLLQDQTITLSSSQVRQLEIQTTTDKLSDKGIIYYWYVSQDKVITDYSQRVWEQFRQPNSQWVLVEVAVMKDQGPSEEELDSLFEVINTQVRSQLL